MIDIRQTYLVAAPPATVAAALVDADILKAAIPNCNRLQKVADNKFWGSASVGILNFRFDLEAIIEVTPTPNGYRIAGAVTAGPVTAGTVEVDLTLAPETQRTRVYSHARVIPKRQHSRIIMRAAKAVSQKLLTKFFERFADAVQRSI